MRIEDETDRFDEQIAENQRAELLIIRWLIDHPDAHPDEVKAKNEMCEQLEQENKELLRRWNEARERWLSQRRGQ